MNIDIKRLEVDREYWNEVAPIDATAAIRNGWVRYGNDGVGESWFWWPFDRNLKQGWRKTLTKCDAHHVPFIPRPTKQGWAGGLPPVGVECEHRTEPREGQSNFAESWERCKVKYISSGGVVVEDAAGEECFMDYLDYKVHFRPIKSQHERQREELRSFISEAVTEGRENTEKGIISEIVDSLTSKYDIKEKSSD